MSFPASKLLEGVMPDRTGSHGRAWQVNHTAFAKKVGKPDATVCAWLVEAPWAHPLWANYCLAAIHLRSLEGLPEAEIRLPDATHQVILFALDPRETPSLENPATTRMNPANFMGQWCAANDIDAEQKIERCVEDIIAGTLSPDTDFISSWIARFSDSNIKK